MTRLGTDESSLTDALQLGEGSDLICIVGGGGKTSLLFALGDQLPGRVILTTTTRIFAEQTQRANRLLRLDEPGWADGLDEPGGPVLVVGAVTGDRAVGVPIEVPGQLLARKDTDWVVVEADGSRMRPVKAPADHEPVIPPESGRVVVMAGIDALSAPIEQVAHRPERVAQLTGLAVHQTLTPEALGRLLSASHGGRKGIPPTARVQILLNKVETASQLSLAEAVARTALEAEEVETVLAGRLKPEPTFPWRVWSR